MPNHTYKPNPLSSGSSDESPLKSSTGPTTGSIVPSLIRLALRRLPGFGYGAVHSKAPTAVKNAVTMGSHGKVT